jgi:hypothetical protein
MRNKCFKQKICMLIMVIAAGLSLTSIATAQTAPSNHGLNIEISPLPINLNAKPGTTVSTDLRVRNTGTVTETIKASLKTFSTQGPDGHVVLKEPAPSDDFIKWVSFSQQEFEAPPGKWQTIKMHVSLPKSAAFGYYYAVQFELANPPKPQPGSARLQGAVAIFVLLDAQAPGAERKITVTSFKADHSTYEFLPAKFNIQVKNTGNVHTAPHGNIFIKKGSRQIATLDVNTTEGMVLPGSSRILTSDWDNGFPVYTAVSDGNGQDVKDAKGNIKKKLKWDYSKVAKLRFGHYSAQLLLVYNDGQRDIPISGTLSFWIIPWRLLAIIAVIILLVGGLPAYVFILRRRLNRTWEPYKRFKK